MKILVVEDDERISDAIVEYLSDIHYAVEAVYDGQGAWDLLDVFTYDLILLDVMLPEMDGITLCQKLRKKGCDIPILMLTAKDTLDNKIEGLDAGADDYLVKPFSPRELVARVRALLRRSLRHDVQAFQGYQSAHFTLDLEQHCATRKLEDNSQENLDLTTLEFNLLATFMSYPGRVWSRTQLIDKLWGNDLFGDERVVDTHIRRLRKKIEPDTTNPTFIKTVVGVGYKFEDG